MTSELYLGLINPLPVNINELTIVIVGEQLNPRSIVLFYNKSTVNKIPVIHRSYDALQYAILF